jgi:hypothetical protein
VIKYRQQGKVRGEKQGKAWRLWLAQDFIDATRAERSGTHSGMDPQRQAARSGTHSEPVEATFTTTPAEVERAIEATGARYVADFAALYDRISAEVGRLYAGQLAAKDEALAAKDEAIAALRRRAELAEREAGAARAALEEHDAAAAFLRQPVIAAQEATLAARDQTIAGLQHRADVAEQEATALRARASASLRRQGEADGDRGTPDASRAESAPGAGLWGRVRRWWQGGG